MKSHVGFPVPSGSLPRNSQLQKHSLDVLYIDYNIIVLHCTVTSLLYSTVHPLTSMVIYIQLYMYIIMCTII